MSYAVEMINITKRFGNLVANDQITLQVKKGEIHALLGENGAGKSTLMSILFGLYNPDEGSIKINGKEVEIKNPNDANDLKIGMVHQHFKLVDVFTVLENIMLGKETTKGIFLDYERAKKDIKDLCKKYNLKVDLDKQIKDITVSMQQKVEIVKMLYRDADILIFDEPTAVLTPHEIDELMKIIRGFSREGKTIIIITHKLDEIKQIADRCTILRRGKLVGTVDVKEASIEKLAEMMVGYNISFQIEKQPTKLTEPLLVVKDISLTSGEKNILKNISFEVRGGEIVGIAGVDGNGQTELINILTGLEKVQTGEIFINNIDVTKSTIKEKYHVGMGHIPEDRQKHGLVLDYTLAHNLILQSFYQEPFQRYGILNEEKIIEHADSLIDKYDIRCANRSATIVRSMSGGNQQKAIIAREMSRKPIVLFAVQPTRGLDIGAVDYIHKQLIKHREGGNAIVLVSFELDEILDLSDRILVMYNGKIVYETTPENTTAHDLGLYMTGASKGEN